MSRRGPVQSYGGKNAWPDRHAHLRGRQPAGPIRDGAE